MTKFDEWQRTESSAANLSFQRAQFITDNCPFKTGMPYTGNKPHCEGLIFTAHKVDLIKLFGLRGQEGWYWVAVGHHFTNDGLPIPCIIDQKFEQVAE